MRRAPQCARDMGLHLPTDRFRRSHKAVVETAAASSHKGGSRERSTVGLS